MSYITYFWKFFHTTKKILESEEGYELQVNEIVSQLDVMKKEIALCCPRPCPICSDHQKCEFLYALVVFGDRMLVRQFGLSAPVLEPRYYNTHIGVDNLLDNISRLIDMLQKTADKAQWSLQQKEFAYVYYYILQHQSSRPQTGSVEVGVEQQKKQESLLETLKSLLKDTEYGSNITPYVYQTIQEEERIFMLPSLWNTVIWAVLIILFLIGVVNGIWYSYTDDIRNSLKQIQQKVSGQAVFEGDKND